MILKLVEVNTLSAMLCVVSTVLKVMCCDAESLNPIAGPAKITGFNGPSPKVALRSTGISSVEIVTPLVDVNPPPLKLNVAPFCT